MDTQKQINDLKAEVERLKQKRVYQQDVVPGAIKMRAMGEANRYIMAGLEADRPDGAEVTSSVTAYFATDTNKYYIWNTTAWVSTTLS